MSGCCRPRKDPDAVRPTARQPGAAACRSEASHSRVSGSPVWGRAQGITPLLAALTASSPGVSVVNIDNGFGAGMLAARMLKMAARLRGQGRPAAAA